MNIQLGEKWQEMIELWNTQIVIYYESDYMFRICNKCQALAMKNELSPYHLSHNKTI